jgi:hypothetical protein
MVRISGILNKVTLSFFVGILLSFYSCKKNKTGVPTKVYDIIQLDFDTNRVVSSIDTFINHPSGCGMIPSPTDSLDVDSLDLNNDLINDSYISAKSWYQFVSASFPCVNYCHSVILASDQSNIQFMKNGMYNQVDTLIFNDVIDSTKAWTNSVTFAMYVPNAPFSCFYQGVHYVGYRVAKGAGYQYGWLKVKSMNNGISIVDGALNRTIDMGIPAGKKVN